MKRGLTSSAPPSTSSASYSSLSSSLSKQEEDKRNSFFLLTLASEESSRMAIFGKPNDPNYAIEVYHGTNAGPSGYWAAQRGHDCKHEEKLQELCPCSKAILRACDACRKTPGGQRGYLLALIGQFVKMGFEFKGWNYGSQFVAYDPSKPYCSESESDSSDGNDDDDSDSN